MKKTRIIIAAAVAVVWLVLAGIAWFGPRTDISEAERRQLQQFPGLTADNLLSGSFMSKFEAFTQDQFPLRDRFRQLKALFSYDVLRKGDNNGIYLAEGSAAKLEYPLKESSVSGTIRKFSKIYDDYLTNSETIRFSIVPDKGYYLAERNGYPAMDYKRLFAMIQEIPWAEFVDITDCLDADCYYTTDTHWRQERILPVAEKIAASLGAEIHDDYVTTPLERPFYGVYYGQAALPVEPETLYLMESETLAGCTVSNFETGKTAAVYDLSKSESRDLYDVFLSGPVSILMAENPQGPEGKELILFRDSFGSSLAPLLVPGYSRITLVDIRYIPSDRLGDYLDFHGQDVLFLYSPMVLNQSTMLK